VVYCTVRILSAIASAAGFFFITALKNSFLLLAYGINHISLVIGECNPSRLKCSYKKIEGKQVWTHKLVTETTLDKVVEMANLGLSQTDIAKELEVNKSTVSRALKSAKDKGGITEKPRVTQGKKAAARRSDVDN
jgi:MarR family